MGPLPNLLVIGAMKAGTTSFHNLLNQHPDILMSDVKEINFFAEDTLWSKGIDWYRSHFEQGDKFSIRGESSVNYSKRHRFQHVPERISKSLKNDVKFIYLLRDPIDRFCSNYTDSKIYGDIPPGLSIDKFVCNTDITQNPIALTGRYYDQISAFRAYFKDKQILFIEFERLIKDTEFVLKDISDFLQLDPFSISVPRQNESRTKSYRSEVAVRLQKFKKFVPSEWRKRIQSFKLVNGLLKNQVDDRLNTLNEKTEAKLKRFYAEDIKLLETAFGFRPAYWRNYQ